MSTFGSNFSDTTTTTSSMDPDIKNRLLDLFGNSPGITNDLVERLNAGYQDYTGDRYLDENVDQEAFYNMVRNNIGSILGGTGGDPLGYLGDIYGDAVGFARNLPSNRVDPVTGQMVSQGAFGGDGNATLQEGARRSIQDVVAQQFRDTNIADYQNPYTDQVINRALSDLDRATQMRMQAADDRATAAGAFGGDRASIERGMIDQESIREAGNLVANLRARGYEDAANRVETDISNQLTADQANQLADRQVSRDAMSIAADLATTNQNQKRMARTDEAVNQLRAAQLLANAFGQGSDVYRDYLADFAGIGDKQLAMDQRDKDFDFEEFARSVDYDQDMIENMINLLRAAPGDRTETSETELSTAGQIQNVLNIAQGASGVYDYLFGSDGIFR